MAVGFSFDVAAAETPQAGRSSSRKVQKKKKKRPLEVAVSPVAGAVAHVGAPFSDGVVEVETQFGTGKVTHYIRGRSCQVIELPWQLAGGARAILYRPVKAHENTL